jgi:thiamine-monophosphate kinase
MGRRWVMTRRIVKSLPEREKSLIERIRRRAARGPGIITGIGDDCAVLRVPRGHELLVTTDFSLENVHFRRAWHAPDVVGWRCLTRGLSDLAAMGGEPRAAFLSLALDRHTPKEWVNRFLDGLLRAAREFRTPLAGGDTAQSDGGIQADIVVVGSVPQGRAVLRSGARPGDNIYVTGALGGSAAGLEQLQKGKTRSKDYERHFYPVARLHAGQWLRRNGLVSAMIDTSDGLSTDLQHLCDESGVGAIVESALLPRAIVGRSKKQVSINLALHGGEDYELLFTSSQKVPARLKDVPVTQIGHITSARGIFLMESNNRRRRLVAKGWQHFEPNP